MLEDGSAPAVVNAVTVKLPGFWSEEPAMWFVQAESQFALRSITVDETKFHHVVAALDQATAKRVADIFLSPLDGPKYEELKKRLLSTFSLTCYQRAQRMLRVSPLGDRRSSELMDEMLALLGQHEPCFLFRTIFMGHLPQEVRTHLVPMLEEATPRDMALMADKLISAQSVAVFGVTGLRKGTSQGPKSSPQASRRKMWCRFHQRYGPKAFNCEQPCSFVLRGASPGLGNYNVHGVLGNEGTGHQ